MGLRDKLNKQPAVVGAVVLIAVLIAVYFVVRTVMGPPRATLATKAFYTVDDGKTWFVDDVTKYPPFKTADGKEAVGVTVISCKGGKDPFVLYMWRYTPEGKQELEGGKSNPGTAMKTEVKKPGKQEWVKQTDYARSGLITQMECPPGQDELVAINP